MIFVKFLFYEPVDGDARNFLFFWETSEPYPTRVFWETANHYFRLRSFLDFNPEKKKISNDQNSAYQD